MENKDNLNQENPLEEDVNQEKLTQEEIENNSTETSQSEKYYNEHKDDYENLFKIKKKDKPEKEKDEFVPDPDKSQAENYFDENMEKLENVYQLKNKNKDEDKPKTSNMDVEKFSEEDLPTVREEDVQDENLPHVHVEYNLNTEEVETGMKLFQKKVLFKRNLIYTIAFVVILIIYFYQMIGNGTRTTISYIGVGICVAAIFIIWYNPWNYRRKTAKAMSTIESNFTMNIYEQYIYIMEESGGFKIDFSDERVFAMEQSDKFIICVGKERIYIVPKRCIENEQQETISKYFSNLNLRFTQE